MCCDATKNLCNSDTEETIEITCCLIVSDFECSPSEITNLLGLQPTGIWLKNTPRIPHPRSTLKHSNNGWKICFKTANVEGGCYEIQSSITKVLETIRPMRESFKELPSECNIELSLVIDNYSDAIPALNINASTILELAYINASIDIDYYHLEIK